MSGLISSLDLGKLQFPKVDTFQEQLLRVNQPYTAGNIFNQLVQQVRHFEKALDQDHEVGMQLVSFGQATQFSVSRIGYMDPSIIWFEGVLENGASVKLMQHVNQVSFLMIALQRQHPEQARNPIGFVQNQQT